MKFFSSLLLALVAFPAASNSQVRATVVLTVATPLAIVERRVDENAAYIVSRPGRVLRWEYNTKKVSTVLNISSLTTTGSERGLLGLAFRGDFAYINYTNTNGHTVIAEYAVNKSGIFRASSRRELITIQQPYANHNGGDIVTGPDNMLYIGMGDCRCVLRCCMQEPRRGHRPCVLLRNPQSLQTVVAGRFLSHLPCQSSECTCHPFGSKSRNNLDKDRQVLCASGHLVR